MLELQLHDWLPYLFSISLLCTLAGAYTAHLVANAEACGNLRSTLRIALVAAPRMPAAATPVHSRLVRHVKRKDAPDDDDSDCCNSLEWRLNHQRGGYICRAIITRYPDSARRSSVPCGLRY